MSESMNKSEECRPVMSQSASGQESFLQRMGWWLCQRLQTDSKELEMQAASDDTLVAFVTLVSNV